MSKQKKKQPAKQKVQKPSLAYTLPIPSNIKKIIPFILLVIPVALGYYYVYYSYSVNKEFSFPLDDSWIHLTFARNLVEFGSFSYFKNEIVTAGSTSPIYTLLLSAGYLFIKNEYYLSYIIGILSFGLACFTLYKLSQNVFTENWLGIAACLIFALDRWLNFFAASGMETTLYIFLLLAAYYCYLKRNSILFGILLGLTFWARPDTAAFIAAVIFDYLIFVYFFKNKHELNKELSPFDKTELIKAGAALSLVLALYFGMNLFLSGTLLPNSFSAKTAYYTPEFRSRTDFLKFEVWGYFTKSSYVFLIAPFLFGVIMLFNEARKLKYNSLFTALLFIIFLIFIYWYKLPFAAVKGRYMVPIIPFYIIISVYGAREFFKLLVLFFNDKKIVNTLNMVFFIITIIFTAFAYLEHKSEYSDQTHRIALRNLAAAKWLKENTAENSVIATHDIGAIGFYTRRKIVDVAGLISPQFTSKLFDPSFTKFMVDDMKNENVSYIAFMNEWYRAVNQNPLFEAGDNNSEVIVINKFDPLKTHILKSDVNSTIMYVQEMLGAKQYQQALSVMQKVISADPLSSYSYFLLANVQLILGDKEGSERSLKKALEIFPEYRDANIALANLYAKLNRKEEAVKIMEGFLKTSPADSTAAGFLRTLKDTVNIKPVK